MVVVIKNAACIDFLRSCSAHNTEIVERIMCEKLGIEPRDFGTNNRGNEKISGLKTSVPVKITDPRIEKYIVRKKERNGIIQRVTVEQAILKHLKKIEEKNERR